jgi:ABC-type uncharacterized transport system permease subunit
MVTNFLQTTVFTIVLAAFIEVILPWQTTWFYNRLSHRHVKQRVGLGYGTISAKVITYLMVFYLSYKSNSGGQIYGLLLIVLIFALCIIICYFRSIRLIIEDFRSKNR